MVKALLQIIGCMFLVEVKSNACWAAQLFGITCIRKFHAAVGSLPVVDGEYGHCFEFRYADTVT
jgi:hypothetical protein